MELNPYAKSLGEREPIPVLAGTPASLLDLTGRLTRDQVDQHPAPGKWSPREIVAHLADCELVFAFRLRQTLAEDNPVIQPFDQDRWSRRYANHDMASALRVFSAARGWNVLLIDGASPAERSRPVTHPERGTMTFWTIVQTMAGHDLHHLRQIEPLVTVL